MTIAEHDDAQKRSNRRWGIFWVVAIAAAIGWGVLQSNQVSHMSDAQYRQWRRAGDQFERQVNYNLPGHLR